MKMAIFLLLVVADAFARLKAFGRILAFTLAACCAAIAATDLPLVHPIFDSHMVFPREVKDPVWGWASAGETVTLTVTDPKSRLLLSKSANAGPDGRWDVEIGPFPASNEGISLAVSREGQPPLVLTDVLIGDVWLCSGQSNMARSLAFHAGIPDVPNQNEEIADTKNYPLIRQYYVGNVATSKPQLIPTSLVTDETGSSGPWLVNNPENAAKPSRYTAVGYFFGRQLHRALKVPIGIVQMSWGGTSIESWIDPVTLSQDPNFPNAATLPENANTGTGGAIYNGKVATLVPFKFKGVVWYQGESNEARPEQYRTLLPLLFKSWRQGFQQPALPFIVIQLPNHQNDNWPILRDAQLNAVKNDRLSRLVVTIDLADPKELHPGDKQDVGIRAARAALNVAYGQRLVASGPIIARARTKGNTTRCDFTDVGEGLIVGKREIPPTKPEVPTDEVVRGTLSGFEIAGADGKFHLAKAVISGRTTVDVSSPEVTSPVSVRYAWAGAPACNLYNRIVDGCGKTTDGLPASPFSIPACTRPNSNLIE